MQSAIFRMIFRGLVALLFALSLGAWAQHSRDLGEPSGPVALDSPAWRDLMAEPVLQDQTLAYQAASVAGLWGHPSVAGQLRRSLLALHGRALAGEPLPARLGELLNHAPPDAGVVQAAWDAGLNRAWADTQWDAQPPPEGLPAGARGMAQRPGFWRLSNDRLAVQPVLRNLAGVVLALPGPPRLTLQVAGHAVQMDCRGRTGNMRWASGEIARFWCTSTAAVPVDVWAALAQSVPLWQVLVPIQAGAVDAWVSGLAGRPPLSLGILIERNAHCRDQQNCLQGKLPTTEELAHSRREAQARQPEEQARMDRKRAQAGQADRWILLAAAVAGFGIYVLAARVVGAALASGLVIVLSVAVGVWFFGQIRSADGWGKMALLIVAVAAPACGIVLATLYAWLYRRFVVRSR